MTSHTPNYYRNVADMNTTVRCTCGWWANGDDNESCLTKFLEHIPGDDPIALPVGNVRKLEWTGVTDMGRDAAKYFREMADRIEAGDVKNIVVAFSNKAEYGYERFAHFHDRWAMYGAIEYMRACIDSAD